MKKPFCHYLTGSGNSESGTLRRTKGFTLVELIIVITILAILGTIAFVSFQGFTKSARDGNRVASISSLETGLELYAVQTGKYPKPEAFENSVVYTGALTLTGINIEYSYMGIIGEQITRTIKMNQTPIDPKTGNKYIYATTKDLKKYQIAGTLETQISTSNIIATTYADNGIQKAKVIGNHKEDVIYDLGNTGTYYTIVPSLIYDIDSGTNILNSTGILSIVNNKGNIPYSTGNGKNNTKKAQELIKELRGNEAEIIELKLPSKEQLKTMTGGELLTYFENNSTYSSGVIKSSMGVITTNGEINYELIEQTIKGTVTSSTTTTQTTGGEETPTGTFSLSSTSVTVGINVTITDNCTISPTSYTSSDTNVATIDGTTITTLTAGTTDITPVGGSCSDSSAKTLTVTYPPTREVYGDEDTDAISACNLWVQNAIGSNAGGYQNWIWVPARNFTTDGVGTGLDNNYYKRNITYNGTNYICNGFAVMKYEAKFSNTASMVQPNATRKTWAVSDYATDNDTYPINLTNGIVSKADDYPIASIRQGEAIQACSGLSYNGVTSHLITDNEWMGVARNIEQVSSNWSGGSVGNGFIYNGHNDWGPQSTLAASTDDNNGYYLTNDSASAGDGVYNNYSSEIALAYQGQRRTLALSNGKVIWDLAGNVWEHVNKRNNPTISNVRGSGWDDNNFPTENMCSNGTWNWYSWYNTESISGSAIAQCSYLGSYSKADFGPSGNWNAENGMGRIYANNSETINNIFLRGGAALTGANSGVFMLNLSWTASTQGVNVGFRCSL